MNSPLAPDEEALLQHYREQGEVQPSAMLDARIMTAARQALEVQSSSPWARFGHWLNRASLTQRGSLAFGSLASVALALGLVWHALPERAGPLYESLADAPVEPRHAMPAEREPLAAMSAPQTVMSRPAAPLAAKPTRPEPLSRSRSILADAGEGSGTQTEAGKSLGTVIAPAKDAGAKLDAGLREVLALRAKGHQAAAEQRFKELQRKYPNVALEQRLGELEAAPTAP